MTFRGGHWESRSQENVALMIGLVTYNKRHKKGEFELVPIQYRHLCGLVLTVLEGTLHDTEGERKTHPNTIPATNTLMYNTVLPT